MRSEIDELYRGPVENRKLYSSEEEAREVVRDLEADSSTQSEDSAQGEDLAPNKDLALPGGESQDTAVGASGQ